MAHQSPQRMCESASLLFTHKDGQLKDDSPPFLKRLTGAIAVMPNKKSKSPLDNARRNNPFFCSEFKQVEAAVDELYTQYEAYKKGQYSIRKDDVAKIKRHIENLVLDLYSVWHSDKSKYLGYSRDQKAFRKGNSYYDHMNKKPMLSKTFFVGVIDFFIDAGYVETEKAKSYKQTADEGIPRPKISSRVRATNKIIAVLHKHKVNWATIQTSSDTSFIILRNDKKKTIAFDPDKYPETKLMQGKLQSINKVLDWCHIDLNVPDTELIKLKKRLSTNPIDDEGDIDNKYREPFELNNRLLKRKFVNDFNSGGRFYGGWWQGCPSEYRKFITVNHRVTTELDYSTIQPHILYAKKGCTVPKDSYLLYGWDKEYRDIYKKAFNQLINSKTGTKNNLSLLAPDITPKKLPVGWKEMKKGERKGYQLSEFKRLTGKDYDQLLTDLMACHEPIKDYFFSQSWKWLQRVDSDIAELVILRMIDRKVMVLPIHDSFIVPLDDKLDNIMYLHNEMTQAFKEVVGIKCKIDIKDLIDVDNYKTTALTVPEDHYKYKINYVEWLSIRGNG
jgi:hypothetical protein